MSYAMPRARRSFHTLCLLGLLLLCASAFQRPRAATAPTRVALLVGVSRYPKTGKVPWGELHAHDELALLRKILIERHGFAPRDVLLLEDERASAQGIRAAFQRHLVARSRPGSVVFFHFSGHGQQVKDLSGDENDGLDESIVPADSTEQAADYGATHNILDDEIASWIRQMAQQMRGAGGQVEGSITLSFDSCYSGTLARGDLVERGRAWDPRLDGPRPRAVRTAATATLDVEPRAYTLLGAAHSNQTAKEVSTEQGTMGAYSYALISALARLPQSISYQTLLHELMVEVRGLVSNQTPELEGSPERMLFGASSVPSSTPFLPIHEVRENDLRILAGALHQVSQGSIYTLHQPGDAQPDATTLLAEAEVIVTTSTDSWLRLLPSWRGKLSARLLRSARVIEKKHVYKDSPLRVRISDKNLREEETVLKLTAALQQLASSGMIVLQPDSAQASDYDLKLVPRPGVVELYRPDNGRPVASVPISPQREKRAARSAGVHEALIAILRAEWRWRRLYRLRGQSQLLHAELRLVPVDARRNAAGLVDETPVPLPGQRGAAIRLPERALYQLEITNRSPIPVWVVVLELAPDGGIQVLFPDPARPGDGLITAGSPPRLIAHPYVFEATAPRGGYTLKLITTAEQTDFGVLAQHSLAINPVNVSDRALKLQQRAGGHPLGDLLVEALTGDLVRGKRTPIAMGTWSVDHALLEVVEGTATAPGSSSASGRTE